MVNNAGFGLSGPAAVLDRNEQLAHDRSQCARADRTVAGLRRQPRSAIAAAFSMSPRSPLSARSRHGGLLRQQGLRAVVQRSAASRAGRPRHPGHGAVPGPGSDRIPVARPACTLRRRRARIFELPAGRVAQIGYDAFMRGKRVVDCRASATGSWYSLMRFLPHALLLRGSTSAPGMCAGIDCRRHRAFIQPTNALGMAQARGRFAGSCNSQS